MFDSGSESDGKQPAVILDAKQMRFEARAFSEHQGQVTHQQSRGVSSSSSEQSKNEEERDEIRRILQLEPAERSSKHVATLSKHFRKNRFF